MRIGTLKTSYAADEALFDTPVQRTLLVLLALERTPPDLPARLHAVQVTGPHLVGGKQALHRGIGGDILRRRLGGRVLSQHCRCKQEHREPHRNQTHNTNHRPTSDDGDSDLARQD